MAESGGNVMTGLNTTRTVKTLGSYLLLRSYVHVVAACANMFVIQNSQLLTCCSYRRHSCHLIMHAFKTKPLISSPNLACPSRSMQALCG